MTADDYARRLALTLQQASAHRHVVRDVPYKRERGAYVFDVELCTPDDLPSGFAARVVVTVR